MGFKDARHAFLFFLTLIPMMRIPFCTWCFVGFILGVALPIPEVEECCSEQISTSGILHWSFEDCGHSEGQKWES